MRKVLFLCTGNSCRSQMAEAIVNARLGDVWQAVSAGTAPAGYVHPLAVRALAEIGIEHTGRSKGVDEFRDATFDLVVTVCDSAAEACPVWLPPSPTAATIGASGGRPAETPLSPAGWSAGLPAPGTQVQGSGGRRVHLAFPDPARAAGSEEEVMAAFRRVRDDMAQQVPARLESVAAGR